MRLAAALVLTACGLSAHAQTQTQTQTRDAATRAGDAAAQTAPADKPSPEQSDLSITARVTARELLFRKVPNPTVEFTGKPERRTLWESERENLPEQVQPGVTYRNVGITLRIVSVFADIDRIVAEALGETPATDLNAPPASGPTPPTPPRATQDPARVSPESHTSPAKAPSVASRRAARRPSNNRGGRTTRTPE